MDLGQLLEQARPWLSTGGIVTTTGVAIRFWFANRKLRLVENADDRAGYGDVIRTLREEVLRLQHDHTRCEDRLSAIEEKQTIERTAREAERATQEAVVALMRHRANNSDQCLDALLMLLEAAPEKVSSAVAQIKEMRIRQREAEALEKAAIHTANIARTVGVAA